MSTGRAPFLPRMPRAVLKVFLWTPRPGLQRWEFSTKHQPVWGGRALTESRLPVCSSQVFVPMIGPAVKKSPVERAEKRERESGREGKMLLVTAMRVILRNLAAENSRPCWITRSLS